MYEIRNLKTDSSGVGDVFKGIGGEGYILGNIICRFS